MSRSTAFAGMTDLMSSNELRKQFQNLLDLDNDSDDDDNDTIIDEDDSITTVPVAESVATDIYNNSAAQQDDNMSENVANQGHQNEVKNSPPPPQNAQIPEQPPTIKLANTRGNGFCPITLMN